MSEWKGTRAGNLPTNSGIMPNSMRSWASTLLKAEFFSLWSSCVIRQCEELVTQEQELHEQLLLRQDLKENELLEQDLKANEVLEQVLQERELQK